MSRRKDQHKQKLVGILGTDKGPHIVLLRSALEKLGAQVRLINPKKLTAILPAGEIMAPQAGQENIILNDLAGLVVRSLPGGSLEQVIYRVDALHCLERSGVTVINSATLIEKTVNKFYTSTLLARAALPVPKTIITEGYEEGMAAVEQLGQVVIKPIFGSLGQGIVRVDNLDVAHRVFRALELGRYLYYIQEFLPSGNEDLRLFVVGEEIVSAMRRRGAGWKANIACGASPEKYFPDGEISRLALETAQILGADYVGVDIIISQGKPYVIEANGIPGWTGLQSVSEVDISQVLAKYILGRIGYHDR